MCLFLSIASEQAAKDRVDSIIGQMVFMKSFGER